MKLLIDGYNLIPAIPDLRRKLREELEQGREGLIAALARYRAHVPGPVDITVVFDGKPGFGRENGGRRRGIEIVYSRGETADDLILRLLRGPKQGALLVTSDRALGAAAREHAGAVIRSGEFADRLIQAQFMDAAAGGEDAPPLPRRRSTKKKGNPRRLPKKERRRKRQLGKL